MGRGSFVGNRSGMLELLFDNQDALIRSKQVCMRLGTRDDVDGDVEENGDGDENGDEKRVENENEKRVEDGDENGDEKRVEDGDNNRVQDTNAPAEVNNE